MKNLNEVNEFITKYKKNMGERIKNSRKNAKEFFLSNLTKKEEDFYQQNGFIEIETESNIYLLKPRSKFNINHLLIVWDKGDEELEAARCYCIEKVENQIEEYDEMASILFALKSKDYEYVEENSNKFNLTKETQAKLKERYVNANLKEEVI